MVLVHFLYVRADGYSGRPLSPASRTNRVIRASFERAVKSFQNRARLRRQRGPTAHAGADRPWACWLQTRTHEAQAGPATRRATRMTSDTPPEVSAGCHRLLGKARDLWPHVVDPHRRPMSLRRRIPPHPALRHRRRKQRCRVRPRHRPPSRPQRRHSRRW